MGISLTISRHGIRRSVVPPDLLSDCAASAEQPYEEVRTMARVLRVAEIETDGVVRLHGELLDWRSGLKSALNFSGGDSYYFDRQLSLNRLSSFRRTS
jgi:hypothetical protein